MIFFKYGLFMRKFNILIVLILVLACFSNCTISKSKEIIWDEESKVLIDEDRNLQWQLSMIADEWRVAEQNSLPEHVKFCAAVDEFGIVVMYLTIPIPNDEMVSTIWDCSKDFLNGMTDAFVAQASSFPGIEYGDATLDRVYYLFKEAICFTLTCDISDARLSTDDVVPFAFRGYSFIKGSEVVQVIAMFPQVFYENYGDEPFDDIFGRFSYIDATKECK